MPFGTPDKSGSIEKGNVLLLQCVTWNTTPSTLEPAPFHDDQEKISIASWARIDNRDELAGKLDISRSKADRICDSELILKCYLKWREDCVSHLIGDFVFVIYDEKQQKVFCGRDHMGVRPFYYFISDGLFVCATSLSALMGLKSVPVKIREQWMVDYLTHLSMSFDQTPYEGIYKLPPAHTLTVTPEKHHLRQYFTLSAEPELKLKDSREYVDAYREQLETAIKCRLNTTYPLGSELSGGIDSSTITAYGAKFFEQPLTNFHTFAFANSELEPQHILAVSQAYGLPYNHVFTGRRLNREGLVERSLKILGYPVEHGSATFHEPFYQLAEKYNLKQRYFDTARFDAGYTDLKRFTLEKRWMPFVPTRMENCILMAAARKIEYRWPLLDIRLVKLFLSIPSEENYYRGMGRYLHRRAIEGVVPKLVTWKKGKDMGNIMGPDHSGRMDTVPNTDLHPELTKLIDVKKFNEQITAMAQSKTGKDDGLTFQFRRNGQTVKNLDIWLKEAYCHKP